MKQADKIKLYEKLLRDTLEAIVNGNFWWLGGLQDQIEEALKE